MKIKSKPFRKAFGVGLLITIIILVARSAMFGGFSAMQNEPPAYAMGIFAVVSIVNFIIPILLGIYYTHLARRDLQPEETFGFEEGAFGGAAVGAATRFLAGIVGAIVPLFMLNMFGEGTVESAGFEPMMFVMIAVSLIFGVIMSVIGGVILGGLGGGVYAAIRDR